MEPFINYQLNVADRIAKNYSNYKKSPKDRITTTYVQTRLEALLEAWQRFVSGHEGLLTKFKPETLADTDYIKDDKFGETEEFYIAYKTVLKEQLTLLQGNSSAGSTASPGQDRASKNNSIKLPKIVIPTFSGKYAEWTTFHDLFLSMVHNNDSLDAVQKLQYLKGFLTGEAEQLLRHIPITQANYIKCWELLLSRYNNKKYLSHCIIKRLLSQRNASSESAVYLKELIDTSSECLNALSNLKMNDTAILDMIIIYILSLKLDGETRKHWELHVTSNMVGDELPTFDQFKAFITNRFRALEFVEQKQVNKSQPAHMSANKMRVMHVADTEQVSQFQCPFCSENHKLYLCEKFIDQSTDARRDFVMENKICFNCLGSNHSAKFCKNPLKCKVCKRRHHSLLHPKTLNSGGNSTATPLTAALATDGDEENSSEETVEEIQANTTAIKNKNYSVLLATVLINLEASNGQYCTVRALLDQGSQASFVTEATVQLLRLKKYPAKSLISGVGGGKTVNSNAVVQLKLKSIVEPEVEISVQAHVLKTITTLLPNKNVEELDWLKTAQIKLADPQYYSPNKIDVLLGAEVYGQILKDGLKKDPAGFLVAQATTFGWVVSGLTNSVAQGKLMVMHAAVNNENDMLKKFWELESEPEGGVKMLTDEENRCEELYSTTTIRDAEGRYIVKLPFRRESPKCKEGNSKQIAVSRFLGLEKRLNNNEKLKEEYRKTFNEYVQLNHMEPVKEEEINEDAVYLPYHEVVREDKDTTKVRIVMNASSKDSNGISLNDELMVGPTLQMDLRHIIMRWRKHAIVMMADIEKMYRQIKVDERDANYQRIVWRDNPNDQIVDYKILRVLFGTSSAPYLAVRSLRQVAIDEGFRFPQAAERVLSDFYMDDLLTGCSTVSEALQVYTEMNALLEKAGFRLQKWSSNSDEVLQRINEGKKDEEKEGERNLKIKIDSVIKILGLTWNRSEDSYHYTVSLPELKKPITKRTIISDIAKLFDPLGWVAPVIIVAKVIIQKLWLAGIGWDDEVPRLLGEEWLSYRRELKLLENIRIPRYVGTNDGDVQQELHGYSDASQVAYAAVVYMRTVDLHGKVHVSLVAAKTKVAPVKQVSIPRLELCGAVLLSKLMAEVGPVLDIPKENWHAWTDSRVVLAWLNDHPSKWKTFIANRVSTILDILEPHQWGHIISKSNPADVASRGLRPTQLKENTIWFTGPDLIQAETIKKDKAQEFKTNLEKNKRTIQSHAVIQEEKLWDKYSQLTKLLRIVAYCRRFLNMRKPINDRHKNQILTNEELMNARDTCIKSIQLEFFNEEIKALTQNKRLPKTSKLLSLSPYLDDKDILRVGGRLENSRLDTDQKHPILVPREGNFTKLLIDYAHKSTMHGGAQLMLSFLHTKYWVIGAKQLVKTYVRKCTICVKNAAVTKTQIMGQLPSVRVTPSRPFKSSGVDFAGLIDIRTTKGRGHRAYKGYICLFICMVTRAVHIEVVSDLSSQGFLAAFKRFVARRGCCTDMYSDNGTNFVGAARELKVLFNLEKSMVGRAIAETLANNGTTWHFIPPRAPNFGGLWEAAIKSTKYHLKRVIGNTTLTYEEMSTVVAQIEACLNSRPLSRLVSDDTVILTPGHFLVGEPLVTAPDRNFETSNISSLRRWQLTQRMLQDFWRRWSQDYINHLQLKYKWRDQHPEPTEGDVVLIKENDLPPCKWLIGTIVKKHPDNHNVTRVVTVRTKNSEIKRPTSKLCVLPTTD